MTISMEIRNNDTCTLRYNVSSSSHLSTINKLKYTGDYVLKAMFEPMIFKYFQILRHVVGPLPLLFRGCFFFLSLVAKIKLCVNVF